MALQKLSLRLGLMALLLLVVYVTAGAARNTRDPRSLGAPCKFDGECDGNHKDPPNFLKCIKQQCKCDHKHLFRHKQCVIKADTVFERDQFDQHQPCVPFAQRVVMGLKLTCACKPGYQYFEDECHSKDAAGRKAGMGYLLMGFVSLILLILV